jgi:hypothetical protein
MLLLRSTPAAVPAGGACEEECSGGVGQQSEDREEFEARILIAEGVSADGPNLDLHRKLLFMMICTRLRRLHVFSSSR